MPMLLFEIDTIRSVRSQATPMLLINRPGFVHTEGVVNGRCSMLSGEWLGAALMGDFKTAWMTLCSPRSMFLAQVVGSFLGCIIAPATFLLFYKAFDIGVPGSAYPAPYATIYRAMAVLGVEVCSPRSLNPQMHVHLAPLHVPDEPARLQPPSQACSFVQRAIMSSGAPVLSSTLKMPACAYSPCDSRNAVLALQLHNM